MEFSLQSLAEDNRKKALEELARRIEGFASPLGLTISEREIWQLKLAISKEFHLEQVPKNSDILSSLSIEVRSSFEPSLRRKSIRTRSGIAVITAMTKPFDCPHGTCTFCPGGVRFATPQSYTQDSPAASFGASRNYDPETQVKDSLAILAKNGHNTSKVELILLGGTILAMPQEYQIQFVKGSYDALNGSCSASLGEALKRNESAGHRCVGLTIETKPDWCRREEIDLLLSYATTRIEIGVQSLRDDVLRATNRGHTMRDTYEAFQVSRDAALKIVAHMMPGLPRSDPEKDLEDLLTLVEDERLKPDMLKIYPTIVVEGTSLFRQYESGKFRPHSLEEIVEILVSFKKRVPPWLRIMRIQREIPSYEIAGGIKVGNLRQIVQDTLQERGEKCSCIRCREVGHVKSVDPPDFSKAKLERIDYEASHGQEIFLSFENSKAKTLFGFLRLRIPSGLEHRPEISGEKAALVRELHVYGRVVPVGEKQNDVAQSQHRGLRTELLILSEKIAREEFGRKKIIVISATGTREYYRKRGYRNDGAYVSKLLS